MLDLFHLNVKVLVKQPLHKTTVSIDNLYDSSNLPTSSQPFITIHKVIQEASHRDQSTFTCKNDDPVVLIWNPMKPYPPHKVEVATTQWWET